MEKVFSQKEGKSIDLLKEEKYMAPRFSDMDLNHILNKITVQKKYQVYIETFIKNSLNDTNSIK